MDEAEIQMSLPNQLLAREPSKKETAVADAESKKTKKKESKKAKKGKPSDDDEDRQFTPPMETPAEPTEAWALETAAAAKEKKKEQKKKDKKERKREKKAKKKQAKEEHPEPEPGQEPAQESQPAAPPAEGAEEGQESPKKRKKKRKKPKRTLTSDGIFMRHGVPSRPEAQLEGARVGYKLPAPIKFEGGEEKPPPH